METGEPAERRFERGLVRTAAAGAAAAAAPPPAHPLAGYRVLPGFLPSFACLGFRRVHRFRVSTKDVPVAHFLLSEVAEFLFAGERGAHARPALIGAKRKETIRNVKVLKKPS